MYYVSIVNHLFLIIQMTSYYREVNIENFVGVNVTKVSPAVSFVRRYRSGSNGVNVAHYIVLSLQNNAAFETQYGNIVDEIEEAVVNLTSCKKGETDCPEFDISNKTDVNKPEDFGQNICAGIIPDPSPLEFYEALNASGWSCVTMCDKNHTNPKNCLNKGVCNVYSGIGPICECANVDSTWYLGDDCSSPIYKVAFYAGLSSTLVVLLLTVGALSGYLYFNKQRQNRKREVQESLVKEWLEEDVVWPKSRGHIPAPSATYSNPSFSADPTSRQGRFLIQTPPRGTAASSTGTSDSGQPTPASTDINKSADPDPSAPDHVGREPAAGPACQLEIVYRSPEEGAFKGCRAAMASTSRRSIWVVFTWVVFTWVVVLCGPLVEGLFPPDALRQRYGCGTSWPRSPQQIGSLLINETISTGRGCGTS
ncbi:unnamed protein product [Boreogadus saida]